MTFDEALQKYQQKPRSFDDALKQYQQKQGAVSAPQEQDGFLKNIAKETANVFARPAVTAFNTALAAKEAIKAGGANLIGAKGLKEQLTQKANEELVKERTIPLLGKVKPVGQTGNLGTDIKDIVGAGAQLGSFVAPVGEGIALGKEFIKGSTKPLLQQLGKTSVTTGTAGATGQAGAALSEDKTFKETAAEGAIGFSGGALLGPALGLGANLIGKLITPIATKTKVAVDSAIEKGIKPYFQGKVTGSQRNAYMDDARKAFTLINEYKPSFADDSGEKVFRNPKNREEMLDALEQVKSTIYKEYDGLKKRAGEMGVAVDLNPLADMLEQVVDKADISLNNPALANSILQKADRYRKQGKLGFDEAQSLLEDMNVRLQNFFKNPTFEASTPAAIDANISKAIRSQMDSIIENTVSPGYQEYRNAYKALKTIERDLARQVNVELRKNTKGLLDYTDIFTGGDLLSGIATGNPAAIAKAVGGRVIKERFKALNDPNRYIAKAFELLEKTKAKAGLPKAPPKNELKLLGRGAIPLPRRMQDDSGVLKGILPPKAQQVPRPGQKLLGYDPNFQNPVVTYPPTTFEPRAQVIGGKRQWETVYHGTNAEFDKFDVKKIGTQTDDGMFGRGFYFTPNKKMAEQAPAGAKAKFVKEVVLDMKNPLDITKFKTVEELADHLNMSESAFVKDNNGIIRPINSQINQFTSHVQDAGYDGVYVKRNGVGDEIVVFDPSKIKPRAQP